MAYHGEYNVYSNDMQELYMRQNGREIQFMSGLVRSKLSTVSYYKQP
jgi:hypothetical protein